MIIGVDIGGTKCAVCIGDEECGIVSVTSFPTVNCQDTLNRIEQEIDRKIEQFGNADAIGISCGSPLDAEKGLILSPPNLPGWDNVPIVQRLYERFGIPAFLENDANACAMAEWKFGAGIGTKNMIFLTFGTGMGAGLILDGKLYRGTNGAAGEVGHIRIAPFGPVGYGKQGSFEGFCSGGGLAQLGKTFAVEQLQMGKTVSFCRSFEELSSITAKKIGDCAKEGHADAKEVFRLCGTMLGKGLSVLIDVLNPECIVIGSIFERCSELLISSVKEEIRRECLADSWNVCNIVPAKLGDNIGNYAAVAVGMENRTNE